MHIDRHLILPAGRMEWRWVPGTAGKWALEAAWRLVWFGCMEWSAVSGRALSVTHAHSSGRGMLAQACVAPPHPCLAPARAAAAARCARLPTRRARWRCGTAPPGAHPLTWKRVQTQVGGWVGGKCTSCLFGRGFILHAAAFPASQRASVRPPPFLTAPPPDPLPPCSPSGGQQAALPHVPSTGRARHPHLSTPSGRPARSDCCGDCCCGCCCNCC